MPSESGSPLLLDDYLTAMEQRQCSQDSVAQDVYTQLAQKEQDLLLAAQLGKALLEKNEELSMQNERMAEDYSRQLEVKSLALFQY